jgi:hypothetical protein
MKIDVKGRLGVTAVVTVSRSRLPPRTPPQHTRRWTKRTCRLSIEGDRFEVRGDRIGARRSTSPAPRWPRSRSSRRLATDSSSAGSRDTPLPMATYAKSVAKSHQIGSQRHPTPRCVNSRANRVRPRIRALGSELLGSAIDLPLGCPRFRGRGTSAAPGARRRPWPARPSGRRPMPAAKRSPIPRFR